jgi:hypothetical protein
VAALEEFNRKLNSKKVVELFLLTLCVLIYICQYLIYFLPPDLEKTIVVSWGHDPDMKV